MRRDTDDQTARELAESIIAARAQVAAAQSALAALCVQFADLRVGEEHSHGSTAAPEAPRAGSYVVDEVALLIGEDVWHTSRLLARTRRVAAALPEVAAAARAGALDSERVRLIDQTARLVEDAHTLTVLDERVVEAARTRTPQALRGWLHRFLAQHEPDSLSHRRAVTLGDRRVTIAQSITGIGYVTGEVSAEDAAAIDGRLTGLARSLGSTDPRTEQQRRSDLFAGLLLGTVAVSGRPASRRTGQRPEGADVDCLEVEQIDPDTGELLLTLRVPIDADGEPIAASTPMLGSPIMVSETVRRQIRIGVVVPLSSVLNLDDAPGELADRSAMLPAEAVRELVGRQDTLITRLLVDDGGRLLDTTELGRFASRRLADAVRLRAGSCVFPNCRVAADRCDLDHHDPVPRGPTSAANLDPLCRRHHRGKTFAGLAAHRDRDTVTWTLPTAHRYRCLDEPLPMPDPRCLEHPGPTVP